MLRDSRQTQSDDGVPASPPKRIAIAAIKAFGADGIIIQQLNEPASGQVVFHLHMHVMPVKAGVELLPPQTRKEDASVLSDHAKRMIAALAGGGRAG